MSISAKLIFLCGKMAAGKSTLARDLAQRENAVLLVQDEFLDRLFPGEITDIPGFVKCSSRLKNALGPHVCALLSKGISVVLDFPGNTKAQRAWFRELFEDLPAGTPWTTDAEFEAITVYFQPPSEDERFNVVRHERAWQHVGADLPIASRVGALALLGGSSTCTLAGESAECARQVSTRVRA